MNWSLDIDWQLIAEFSQWFFLGYFFLLNLGYLALNLASLLTLRPYIASRALESLPQLSSGLQPPISLLVPAYNEETTIASSLRSMLQLAYSDYEIVVVNDGSRDDTLQVLTREFDLQPFPEAYRARLAAKPVRGIYRSTTYPNLRVIDKENGGKADALNAGINAARNGLFCAVDADSILQRDSLLRVVQPFLEDERTVAAGGTVRIANGSRVRGGFLEAAGIPDGWLGRFQIVEYLRAFLFGRLGWSPLNAVLIISGAFGLFDRARVIAAGGYRSDTVGEDMELVVRLHRWHRERKIPYRIRYVPDPICWTEAPEDAGTLGRQRSRWQRGLSESLAAHAGWALGPRGGAPGWLAWPFMAVFEWFGPLVEVAGYGFMLAGFAAGVVSPLALAVFMAVAIGMGIMLSVNGLLLEAMSFRVYTRKRDSLLLFAVAILENLGYRQLNTLWRVRGLWQWAARRKQKWGVMKRSGTWGQ